MVIPEEAGTGHAPQSLAQAAAERIRSGLSPKIMNIAAAVLAPTAADRNNGRIQVFNETTRAAAWYHPNIAPIAVWSDFDFPHDIIINGYNVWVADNMPPKIVQLDLNGNREYTWEIGGEGLRSSATACRTVMPSVVHVTDQYANKRAEVSHQPTRQRKRQMRRFMSAAHVQRFASVHGVVQTLFRVGRHLLRSRHHRVLRRRAFVEWDTATCAC